MKKGLLITSIVQLLAAAAVSLAQVSYRVSGNIVDANGAAVSGARISLSLPKGRSVVSASDGRYEFDSLLPGDYQLTVTADGFKPESRNISITNGNVSLDIALEVGSPSVTVTAEIGQEVERQNVPQAVNLISSRQIMERAGQVLAQVAEEEVGVNVQRTSPTMGGIFVRGLVGSKVNVYVDGVRYTTSAQRGGVSTFFNLTEPSGLDSVEILRGSSSAQYGSDALGGTVGLLTRNVALSDKAAVHGNVNTLFNSADLSFGNSTLLSFGTSKLGGYGNFAARRVSTIRVAKGLDTHSALSRFLGLPSDILGSRLPDTAFTQYGGAVKLNFAPRSDQQLIFYYSRSQQDGGKRYDQLLGGDGNLIADLRNLMLDLGYLRYVKQSFLGFDSASFTASFNSQREERVNQGGQGDPFGNITHQYERTTANGFNFFLEKVLPLRNSLLVGGDLYSERVSAPAYTYDPRTNAFILSRPRIPDGSRYLLIGMFVQDAWQAVPERLRISGALRYNVAKYKARGSDSPIVAGSRLWGDDDLSVADFSGRIGLVFRIVDEFRIAASYGRGFRAPSITDLGTLGLTGDGYEVDHVAAARLGGTIGTTAGAAAVSTGIPVSRQRSEITNNYDLSVRYRVGRFETEATVFLIDFKDTITKQALILPPGSVGQFLGDQQIIGQLPNGVVFVSLSTAPVLVRANYSAARIFGFEYEAEARLSSSLKMVANYTFIRAEDKQTGLPPNIEGGTPPATGFISVRYEPAGKSYWFEFYTTLAAEQDRLSTLDLSDRRTGATRSRSQIQNFFRRGACMRGLTNNPDGLCGTGDETLLLPTGETIAQVQDRVLGPGVNSAPMFTRLPGYGLFNLRGGFRVGEGHRLYWAFENIFDRQYRNPSWGMDAAGRSLSLSYSVKF